MLDIIQDLNEAIEVLEKLQLRYAVVGGIAVAFHGGERSTFDIDFLIHPDDVEAAVNGLKERRFVETSQPWTFKTSGLTLRRVWRMRPGREDASLVDFLSSPEPRYLNMLAGAESMPWAGGKVAVARIDDLLTMKSATGRHKDLGDVETLREKQQGGTASGADTH